MTATSLRRPWNCAGEVAGEDGNDANLALGSSRFILTGRSFPVLPKEIIMKKTITMGACQKSVCYQCIYQ